jgi:hypothetical protein
MRSAKSAFLLLSLLTAACGGSGVEPATAVALEGPSEMYTGTTERFAVRDASNEDYRWSSSDERVARVDARGVVTGVAAGRAEIRAVALVGGAQGVAQVTVNFIPEDDLPFYEDWSQSGHADETSEAFRHWDDDGVIPASCAKCHSRFGFHDFLGEDGSTPGQVDSDHPTGSVVDCVTCHNSSSLGWTEVEFPSGVVIEDLGREAVCMECHQGRSSTDSVDAAIDAVEPAPETEDSILPDRGFINVHYYPAAATRYGGQVRGGYLYEGQSYDVRFRHVEGAHDCQECHNPHSLQIKIDECSKCHTNVNTLPDTRDIRMESSVVIDYDGDGDLTEGLFFEIDGLRTTLYGAIQAYCRDVVGLPIVYDSHSYPYWFNDTNGNGDADPDEVSFGNRYTTFTTRSLKSTYNFQYATKDPGGFAHNGKFIIQIVHDSIQDMNAGLEDNEKPTVPFTGVRNDIGHFDGTAEAFRHWDEDGEVSASCAKCHSASEGFVEYLTFGKNTSAEIANGFDCAVCHTTFDTFDLRIVRTVEFPSGYETIPALGDQSDPAVQSNLCMTCHQGRISKVQIDEAIDAGQVRFLNIHYLAAGATLMGNLAKGGYEYDGLEYSGRWPHSTTSTNNNCTDCHNPLSTDHTFRPDDNLNYCKRCHTNIEKFEDIRVGSDRDYNRNGDTAEPLKDELQSIAADLLERMQEVGRENEAPLCYDSHGYPYFFNDLNDNGICDPNEANYGNRYQDWTPALVKAAHNYQQSQKEPGAWVHNFRYITQLVIDSYRDLEGDPEKHIRPHSLQ